MNTVTSKDGTTIAFDRTGEGPALILVGERSSTGRSTRSTARLAELLSPDFTVYHYDRRGRGDSGDTAPYAVEREIEDIDALIQDGGGSAFLFGMSSGAVLALEAAAHGSRSRSWRCTSRRSSSTTAAHRCRTTTGSGSPSCWRRVAEATRSSSS